MLRHWLESPYIREWWGAPETELGKIRDKVAGRDTTRPFIFHVDGDPLGYIQSWCVGDEIDNGNTGEAPWLVELPRDAAGVDLFIGEPDRLGKGIGTAVLRAFVSDLFSRGTPMIVIDPDETNARAVRAYEKAGFTPFGRYDNKDGVTLLMTLTPERFAETAA